MSELSKTTPAEPEWVAFAAIDWANRKHFWRLLPAGSQRYEEGELDNTPEAIEVWASNLQRRFGGRPIAVCREQSRGPLVYTLTNTRTWCCSRYTPLPQRTTARHSPRRAPRAIPMTRLRCWICGCAIVSLCAPCSRIPRRPACCISW